MKGVEVGISRKVTFRIDVPNDVSDDDILRWLRYELGELGDLSLDNPMSDVDLEAEFGSVQLN